MGADDREDDRDGERADDTEREASTDAKVPAKKKRRRAKAKGSRRAPVAEIAVAPLDQRAREKSIRTMMLVSAAAALIGIGLVGTGPSLPGMVLCILGVGGLVVGIHRFGRLGPEET